MPGAMTVAAGLFAVKNYTGSPGDLGGRTMLYPALVVSNSTLFGVAAFVVIIAGILFILGRR